jgi:hypothetical protein
MSRRRVWSNAEKDFLRNCSPIAKDEEILKDLLKITSRKITLKALRHIRRKIGVFKELGRGHCRIRVGGWYDTDTIKPLR